MNLTKKLSALMLGAGLLTSGFAMEENKNLPLDKLPKTALHQIILFAGPANYGVLAQTCKKMDAFLKQLRGIDDNHGSNQIKEDEKSYREVIKEFRWAREREGKYSSLLSCAIKENNIEIFNLLLHTGVDINRKSYLKTPLMLACEKNQLGMIQILLRKGATGDECLIWSIRSNKQEVFNMLIESGVNVNQLTYKRSPLMEACSFERIEMIETLFPKTNPKGFPDYYLFLNYAHLLKGGNTKSLADLPKTILSTIVKFAGPANYGALAQSCKKMNNFLIQLRGKGNTEGMLEVMEQETAYRKVLEYTKKVRTPGMSVPMYLNAPLSMGGWEDSKRLIWMVCYELQDQFEILLNCGVKPTLELLEKSFTYNNEKLFKVMLQKGCIINQYHNGHPLLNAISPYGSDPKKSFVNLLLDYHADVNMCERPNDDSRGSPLVATLEKKHTDLSMLLLDRGVDVNQKGNSVVKNTPLYLAVENKDFELVELLLKKGANVNEINYLGETPLFPAIYGKASIFHLLLDSGADINNVCFYGTTPLFKAAQAGWTKGVEIFWSMGAKINVICTQGCSPLFGAIKGKFADTVHFLLEKKAEVNIKSKWYNWTPLHQAVSSGNIEIIEALLKKDADVNAKETSGYHHSPLDFARFKGKKSTEYKEIIELLEKWTN